jgi:plasmid stabilization system protein ParE
MKLEDKCQALACSPDSGFPMLQDSQVRIWPVQNYVIVFRRRGEEIEVLRVLHGARDLEDLLGDEPQ